jgi:hypothetical protein
MKRNLFLLGLAALLCMPVQRAEAQENTLATKAIYGQIGGPGLITSFHFDGRFKSTDRLGLGYNLGVGFAFADFETHGSRRTRSFYSLPVGLNYLFGHKDSAHTFEFGAGAALLTRKISMSYNGDDTPGNIIGYVSFAYRIMPVDGGFSFRVGLTPLIGTSGDLFPIPVVGFGYAF